jgi:hypothetical protein
MEHTSYLPPHTLATLRHLSQQQWNIHHSNHPTPSQPTNKNKNRVPGRDQRSAAPCPGRDPPHIRPLAFPRHHIAVRTARATDRCLGPGRPVDVYSVPAAVIHGALGARFWSVFVAFFYNCGEGEIDPGRPVDVYSVPAAVLHYTLWARFWSLFVGFFL